MVNDTETTKFNVLKNLNYPPFLQITVFLCICWCHRVFFSILILFIYEQVIYAGKCLDVIVFYMLIKFSNS